MELNINIQGKYKGETYQDIGGLPPLLNNFLWENSCSQRNQKEIMSVPISPPLLECVKLQIKCCHHLFLKPQVSAIELLFRCLVERTGLLTECE